MTTDELASGKKLKVMPFSLSVLIHEEIKIACWDWGALGVLMILVNWNRHWTGVEVEMSQEDWQVLLKAQPWCENKNRCLCSIASPAFVTFPGTLRSPGAKAYRTHSVDPWLRLLACSVKGCQGCWREATLRPQLGSCHCLDFLYLHHKS